MRKPRSNKTKTATPAKGKALIFQQWWFWVIVVAVVLLICIKPVKDALTKQEPTLPTDTSPQITYITCKVGETFDANGMHITYLGAEEWLPAGETAHPKENHCFVRLKIAAENKSTENREIYSEEFTCWADGSKEVMEYFSDERLQGGILAPGEKTEGYIYFTVFENAASIAVEYQSVLTWRNNVATLPVELKK